jgi:hypothetical protein
MNQTVKAAKLTWPQAYKAFLLDKDQKLLLKIAPLALLVGAPEIIVSNVIPVVGEFADLGGVSMAALVLGRTYLAVRKYR